MTIQLNTSLKNINFSENIKNFWDDKFIKHFLNQNISYSLFSNKLPHWTEIANSDQRVFELLNKLVSFYHIECDNSQNDEHSLFFSVQMLNILSQENVDIDQVFFNTYQADPQNKGGWSIDNFFSMHLDYLNSNNEKISEFLMNRFILDIEKNKKWSSRGLDHDVDSYFKLLKALPPKNITYEFFSSYLQFFCSHNDQDSNELMHSPHLLNYDSQKKIHDYISQYFPEHLNDNEQYYSNFLSSNTYCIEHLYQSSVSINLFQLLKQLDLKHKDTFQLCEITKHCLKVVSSCEFMQIINEDIHISNVRSTMTQFRIIFDFSTTDQNQLKAFENIFLTSLKAVLDVYPTITCKFSQDYDVGDTVITNMDAKFIANHYLHQTLEHTLSKSNAKKQSKKI